jgi:hypothetical protein
VALGRLHGAVAGRGQAELLQFLAVQLQRDRFRPLDEVHLARVLEVRTVRMLVEALGRGELAAPEAAVLDVSPQLLGIGLAAACLAAVHAAPAGQRPDPGLALVIH